MSIRKFICSAVLAAFTCVSLSGCYGSYALFNKVQSWNGSIGDKWVNSVVNFVFWIIPVYGISLLADFFILNTIEFWVGSNPVAMGDTYEETDGNGNKIYAVKNSDGTLSVNIVGANGSKADFILERDGDIIRAIDIGGALIAQRIINAEGVLVAQK